MAGMEGFGFSWWCVACIYLLPSYGLGPAYGPSKQASRWLLVILEGWLIDGRPTDR